MSAQSVIPMVDLSGTPAQIGAGHGESQRERIRGHVEQFLGFVLRASPLALTRESLWERWAPQVAANQRMAPGLIEEMQGIARGAGVPFEQVFLLNSMLDLNAFRYAEMAQNFGCSTFAVAAEAGSGKTLIGQTYDMPELHQNFNTVLRLRPSQGPRQLVFTFAGIVGCAGMNEAGLALNINYLSPLDTGLGRLHSVIVRQVLASTSLADALAHPVVPPRAGGAHFLIADREGDIVSIETTAKRFAVRYPGDGETPANAIGHTNHYLSEYLKQWEHIRAGSIGSSLARYTALRRFLREQGAQLTIESLKELTRNHTSYPRSICAHGTDAEQPGARGRTVSAMVQVPADGVLHITAGCACEHEYRVVELK
jgi:isopenicillin-N N-acyltransferase-like protein